LKERSYFQGEGKKGEEKGEESGRKRKGMDIEGGRYRERGKRMGLYLTSGYGPGTVVEVIRYRERKCADTIGTVPVPRAGR